MMLTVDTLPAFLLEQGLITPEAILDGDLEVTTRPRRNRNLRVTSSEGGYLVKQPEEQTADGTDSLRREAAFYAFCREDPAADAIRGVLPRIVLADPARGMLALELLRDAEPLWRFYDQFSGVVVPADPAASLGSALARLHRAFAPAAVQASPGLAFLPRSLPWVLTLHRPATAMLTQLSAAGFEVLRIIQTDPALVRGLEEARGRWLTETVIHGDVKLDNVLVRDAASPDPSRCSAICLVDWETVQVGDPAWDVGSALHDLVVWWIVTLPRGETVDDMAERARFPLPALQPAMRALWRGYRETSALDEAGAETLLERAVHFAAVRLVQTGYEMAGNFSQLPAPTVLMLQVAANVLADPGTARGSLFGLSGHGREA